MEYLTYEEYKEYGGDLSDTDFKLFEFRARKRIDYLTDCRVQAMAEVPEAVKLCMMQIIKLDQKAGADALAEKPLVSSFNTDGYSESYGSAKEQADLMKETVNASIRAMLYGETDDLGVPLLFRGVCGY